MRTAPARRRDGIASMLLQHIITEATRMGFTRLSLETGSYGFFARGVIGRPHRPTKSYAYGVAAGGDELGRATVVSCRGSAPSTEWSSTFTERARSSSRPLPRLPRRTTRFSLGRRSRPCRISGTQGTGVCPGLGNAPSRRAARELGAGPAQRASAHDRTAAVAW